MSFRGGLSSKISFIRSWCGSSIPPWLFSAVLFPFFITRSIWLWIAWFSSYFLPNPTYQKYVDQGWFLSPHFLIDIWSRWDAKWYLSIIEEGYHAPANISEQINNTAFYPFYPYLVKGLSFLVPAPWISRSVYLFIGLLVSNLAFLLASALLYKFVRSWNGDESRARYTLEYLFVFPTSFFFSCFYTESVFFLLSIAAVMAAEKKKWLTAGLLGSCLALTRPQGVLILIPLLWYYLSACDWKWKGIKLNIAWFGLIPSAVLLHFWGLWSITGNFWAVLLTQKAWGRGGSLLRDIQVMMSNSSPDAFKIESLIWVIFILITIWGIKRIPSPGLWFYSLALLILPVSTGSVMSVARFLVVIFPVFILLSDLIRSPLLRKGILGLSFAIQVVYFLGWVNYYWIA